MDIYSRVVEDAEEGHIPTEFISEGESLFEGAVCQGPGSLLTIYSSPPAQELADQVAQSFNLIQDEIRSRLDATKKPVALVFGWLGPDQITAGHLIVTMTADEAEKVTRSVALATIRARSIESLKN